MLISLTGPAPARSPGGIVSWGRPIPHSCFALATTTHRVATRRFLRAQTSSATGTRMATSWECRSAVRASDGGQCRRHLPPAVTRMTRARYSLGLLGSWPCAVAGRASWFACRCPRPCARGRDRSPRAALAERRISAPPPTFGMSTRGRMPSTVSSASTSGGAVAYHQRRGCDLAGGCARGDWSSSARRSQSGGRQRSGVNAGSAWPIRWRFLLARRQLEHNAERARASRLDRSRRAISVC